MNGKETSARTFAFINQKGGVGKTTTTVSVAGYLGFAGYRVLLVDIDPQGNTTFSVGREDAIGNYDVPSMFDLLSTETNIDDIIQRTKYANVDLITCDIRTAYLESECAYSERRIPVDTLRRRLAPVLRNYDYIVVDTPPSLGTFTTNSLHFVQRVIVPIESTDPFSIIGFSQLKQAVERAKLRDNFSLHIMGYFRTMWDKDRTNIGKDLWSGMLKNFPHHAMNSSIPISVKIKESTLNGVHISEYAGRSEIAQAYLDLTEEILTNWEAFVRW